MKLINHLLYIYIEYFYLCATINEFEFLRFFLHFFFFFFWHISEHSPPRSFFGCSWFVKGTAAAALENGSEIEEDNWYSEFQSWARIIHALFNFVTRSRPAISMSFNQSNVDIKTDNLPNFDVVRIDAMIQDSQLIFSNKYTKSNSAMKKFILKAATYEVKALNAVNALDINKGILKFHSAYMESFGDPSNSIRPCGMEIYWHINMVFELLLKKFVPGKEFKSTVTGYQPFYNVNGLQCYFSSIATLVALKYQNYFKG